MITSWLKKQFIQRVSKRYLHHQLAKELLHALWFSVDAIKKTVLPNGQRADALPVCLMLGAAKSGKSALMLASGCPLPTNIPLNSTYEPMKGQRLPTFYASTQALFVEVPQYFLINESKKQIPYLEQLLLCWRQAGLFSRVNQILFTVSADKLFQIEKQKQPMYDEFWHSVQLLLSQLQQPKIHLVFVITGLDRLLGFNEFFSDLSLEERQQYFGFALQKQETWLKSVHMQLIHLAKRLQRRMLWRCQSELILERRLLVAEFPKQFTELSKAFLKYITPLSKMAHAIPRVKWQACFFSSAMQRGEPNDWLVLKDALGLPLKTYSSSQMPVVIKERVYFVWGIFHYLKKHCSALSAKQSIKNRFKKTKKNYSLKKIMTGGILAFMVFAVGAYAFAWWHIAEVLKTQPELAYRIVASTYAENNRQNFVDYETPYFPKNWQHSISQSAHLKALLNQNTMVYLNKRWKQDILSFYQQKCLNRYPLDPLAQDNISWHDFNQFYAPNGLLMNFYHQYLKQPAVQDLLMNQKELQLSLERIQLLGNYFYHNPLIGFSFTLYPDQMDPVIKMLILNLQNQTITMKPGMLSAQTFHWSAEASGLPASLQIEFKNSPSRMVVYKGDWAWLRLLQSFRYQRTNDPNTYILMSPTAHFSLQLNTTLPLLTFYSLLPQLTIPTTL